MSTCNNMYEERNLFEKKQICKSMPSTMFNYTMTDGTRYLHGFKIPEPYLYQKEYEACPSFKTDDARFLFKRQVDIHSKAYTPIYYRKIDNTNLKFLNGG